eukprot:gnl/MRDRNA2_/MRDRNA2_117172_c0_seq1.p1 gnl/MRDRNA2_/MRDRNA2_117172_c0~~gnl/MRDRNA2_/MRDRNA2_117172_c0_seq1.p1  ORF type:complete len:675 (-),score=162.17 gnl/MRDRNA2_/MRDRNA2_117172_c0_seq1:86-2110(-)
MATPNGSLSSAQRETGAGEGSDDDACSSLTEKVRSLGFAPPLNAGSPRQQQARHMYRAAASQDSLLNASSILMVMRREMAMLEERMAAQICRINLDITSRDGPGAEGSMLKRLEDHILAMKGLQPALDKRLAELSGRLQGLGDEVQLESKRMDSMDERLRDWRRDMEAEWRNRAAAIEQGLQDMMSSTRVSAALAEDQQKQQNNKLRWIEDRIASMNCNDDRDNRYDLEELEVRLQALEINFCQDFAEDGSRPRNLEAEGATGANSIADLRPEDWQLDRRIADLEAQVERIATQGLEVQSSSEEHAIRLTAIRSKLDAQEEISRKLGDRLEKADFETRIEQLRQSFQQSIDQFPELRDTLGVVQRRTHDQEQSLEELGALVHQLQLRSMHSFPEGIHGTEPVTPASANSPEPKQAQIGFAELEAQDKKIAALEKIVNGNKEGIRVHEAVMLQHRTDLDTQLHQLKAEVFDVTMQCSKLESRKPEASQESLHVKPPAEAALQESLSKLESRVSNLSAQFEQQQKALKDPTAAGELPTKPQMESMKGDVADLAKKLKELENRKEEGLKVQFNMVANEIGAVAENRFKDLEYSMEKTNVVCDMGLCTANSRRSDLALEVRREFRNIKAVQNETSRVVSDLHAGYAELCSSFHQLNNMVAQRTMRIPLFLRAVFPAAQ